MTVKQLTYKIKKQKKEADTLYRYFIKITGIAIFLIFSLYSFSFSEESMTITTYYPSPYGSYRELTSYRMKIGTTYSGSGTSVSDNNLIVEGNVGIGMTNPTVKLDVDGTINATKVTAEAIDPVYDINGVKYATYGLSSIGIREEIKGVVRLNNNLSYTIDFTKTKAGDDEWLFWNVIGKKISNISVILTPAFNGNVWYTKGENSITFSGTHAGEISFQLSAPRFDAKKWPNFTTDNVKGVKIE